MFESLVKKPPFFNHLTNRRNQVALLQLRLNFSNLNYHLFLKGCIESQTCACGSSREDTKHFLLSCTMYNEPRQKLSASINNISNNININVNTLLYGINAQYELNNAISNCLYEYIEQTGRLY